MVAASKGGRREIGRTSSRSTESLRQCLYSICNCLPANFQDTERGNKSAMTRRRGGKTCPAGSFEGSQIEYYERQLVLPGHC